MLSLSRWNRAFVRLVMKGLSLNPSLLPYLMTNPPALRAGRFRMQRLEEAALGGEEWSALAQPNSDRGLSGGSVLPQPKMSGMRRTDEQTCTQEPYSGLQAKCLGRHQGRKDTFRVVRAVWRARQPDYVVAEPASGRRCRGFPRRRRRPQRLLWISRPSMPRSANWRWRTIFRRSAHQGRGLTDRSSSVGWKAGIAERKAMIDPEHDLPIKQQARGAGISRSTVYYEPRPISAEDLWLMRRIDELHLNYPFAGSRMLRDLLWQQGLVVGRRHIKTLMKRMVIEAIYRKPNTSKPSAKTQDLSLSAARTGHHAAQPGLGHGYNLQYAQPAYLGWKEVRCLSMFGMQCMAIWLCLPFLCCERNEPKRRWLADTGKVTSPWETGLRWSDYAKMSL